MEDLNDRCLVDYFHHLGLLVVFTSHHESVLKIPGLILPKGDVMYMYWLNDVHVHVHDSMFYFQGVRRDESAWSTKDHQTLPPDE